MLNFQQGDQYAIPIQIKQGSTTITPDNCDDVRIKVSDTLKSYLDGTVTFNSDKKLWQFGLTEEQSRTLTAETPIQIGVKQGTEVFYSQVQIINFRDSIITEDWIDA